MSKNKRYFWLKLKEDFFNQKEIKLLRKIAGGDTYTIIYLKLLLLSLKNDGKIYFDGLTDEFTEELALEIDESLENVQVTMQFLQSKGLIAFDSDNHDEFELTNIASMIGSETDDARRKRKERQRKQLKLGQSPDNVTNKSQLCHTEKEIELDKDIEKEKYILSDSKESDDTASKVIEYLNTKANKRFRATPGNLKFINGRIKDGFELDDFKKVIDSKVSQWLNDSKMNEYLRPKTLFNTENFESYLNSAENQVQDEYNPYLSVY